MMSEHRRPAPRAGVHTAAVTDDCTAVRTEPLAMALAAADAGSFQQRVTVRTVTAMAGTVVGLTFLFGFGNVWTLALSLGVPPWVAPLVAPAVDLSVLGLLLAIRHMALHGAGREQMRPARRLLIFSGAMTLALNVADPLITGQFGKAAFDAVGPLLLIGWAEVGPGLLQTLGGIQRVPKLVATADQGTMAVDSRPPAANAPGAGAENIAEPEACGDDLLDRARREDARHWEAFQRPISADTLRKRLHVGAARSRMLVAMVRAETSGASWRHTSDATTAAS
ncbi:SpdA protein [Streptomyces sp. NPDC059900]|uniref:SpdA protein n=1 Tax=Streptomyces sp. NPDC059900 TaxID=3155816 RepID=UPI003426AA7F